jgi:hypothetical protein
LGGRRKYSKSQQQLGNNSKNSTNEYSNAASTTPNRNHKFTPYGNIVHASDNGYGGLKQERSRMGCNVSIPTAIEFNAITGRD